MLPYCQARFKLDSSRMVSILAIIVNSLSKQFYESFSNLNYGSIVGGGHMLEGKKVCFQGNRWLEGKFY